MSRLFTNNAAGKLNANILAGDTALTLQAGQGALFPNPTGGDFFTFTIINNSNVLEIIKCTARTGDVFTTIVRAQEGTAAIGFTAGDRVELRLTAAGIRDKQDRASVVAITGNITLTGVDAYQEKEITAAAAIVLPLASDAHLQLGDWIDFKSLTGGSVTIAPQGADLLDSIGSGTPFALSNLDSVRAVLRAAGNWVLMFKPPSPNTAPICNGRLTLTTGVPVTIADVLAATIVYFTPYVGNRISTFNGSVWNTSVFSEKSVSVPGTTNKPFDVFIVDGTLALETVDWSDDLTRATNIALQDGVFVKSTDHTRRYLGTGRTTAVAGQCEKSHSLCYLYNYYNQKPHFMFAVEPADSWTYTIATYRQANANTANQFSAVIGVQETLVSARVDAVGRNDAGGGAGTFFSVGIGVDSSTVNSAKVMTAVGSSTIGAGFSFPIAGVSAIYKDYPPIGKHDFRWLEISQAVGTTIWFGDNGVAYVQSGITGELLC